MTTENSMYTHILTKLRHGRVSIEEFESIDVDEFIQTLTREGAEVLHKEGFLYWSPNSGFGLHTISARIVNPVYFMEQCTSTNDRARQEIKKRGISRGVFVTRDQTAGRGRLGRTWLSDAENSLTCSLVVTPGVPMNKVACCSLVWMAAIAERLGLFVKWPNDLVSRSGKKIAGCLVELVDDKPTLIFGVGVNVYDTSPIIDTASSLILEKKEYTRMEVLEIICDVVYNTSDFSLECWRKRALYMGQRIRVRDIEGVMTGIRDDGALLINEHVIFTGDVELVEDKR